MDGEEDCAICGSSDFYDEDGRLFCRNGHDQGRGLVTAEDDADFARQGNVVRKKVKREKQKVSKGRPNFCASIGLHGFSTSAAKRSDVDGDQCSVEPKPTNFSCNPGSSSCGSNAIFLSTRKDFPLICG